MHTSVYYSEWTLHSQPPKTAGQRRGVAPVINLLCWQNAAITVSFFQLHILWRRRAFFYLRLRLGSECLNIDVLAKKEGACPYNLHLLCRYTYIDRQFWRLLWQVKSCWLYEQPKGRVAWDSGFALSSAVHWDFAWGYKEMSSILADPRIWAQMQGLAPALRPA